MVDASCALRPARPLGLGLGLGLGPDVLGLEQQGAQDGGAGRAQTGVVAQARLQRLVQLPSRSSRPVVNESIGPITWPS
ncbi:hypothetical protein [Streptomyces flaveus]